MHDDILLYASPNGDRWYFVRDAIPSGSAYATSPIEPLAVNR
jgi:hypothetical protein